MGNYKPSEGGGGWIGLLGRGIGLREPCRRGARKLFRAARRRWVPLTYDVAEGYRGGASRCREQFVPLPLTARRRPWRHQISEGRAENGTECR